MVLDASFLNTQHYKVSIKGKVEQAREWSSAPLLLGVVAIEKGAFESPSTKVTSFTLLYLHTKQMEAFCVWLLYVSEVTMVRLIVKGYCYNFLRGAVRLYIVVY